MKTSLRPALASTCDAYDFHVYGDSVEVRDIIENLYPAMCAKYGDKKPIWSTELGLNSHGMARLPVATRGGEEADEFLRGRWGELLLVWHQLPRP